MLSVFEKMLTEFCQAQVGEKHSLNEFKKHFKILTVQTIFNNRGRWIEKKTIPPALSIEFQFKHH